MNLKILSISVALPGWVAKFSHKDGEETYNPVAFWAVVEDDGFLGHRVTGFSRCDGSGFSPDDTAENFEGWEKVDDKQEAKK